MQLNVLSHYIKSWISRGIDPLVTAEKTYYHQADDHLIYDFNFRAGKARTEIREFKVYLYGKRQTSDSSWEFVNIENE